MESIQILSPYLYRGLIPSKKEKRKLGNGNRVLELTTAEDSLKGNELLAPVFSHSATKGASVGWKENYFVNIHPTVL